jgi:hypothetical protein
MAQSPCEEHTAVLTSANKVLKYHTWENADYHIKPTTMQMQIIVLTIDDLEGIPLPPPCIGRNITT